MRLLTTYFLIGLLLTSFSCDDKSGDWVAESLEIELVVLDEDMNEANEFSGETNMWFMLKAINHSETEIDLSDLDYCSLINDDNFLLVYKKDDGNIPIGRPFPDNVTCAAVNLPRLVPSKGSHYLVGGKWLYNPDNSILSPGKYFSDYNININGKDFYASVEFTVE